MSKVNSKTQYQVLVKISHLTTEYEISGFWFDEPLEYLSAVDDSILHLNDRFKKGEPVELYLNDDPLVAATPYIIDKFHKQKTVISAEIIKHSMLTYQIIEVQA